MISENYRTDHLLLLVGSNPLPNLVAAELLLRENGVLHLIFSAETAGIADNLKRHLEGKKQVRLSPAIQATDAQDIESAITQLVRGLTGTIGLHYTGGTKAMAVHAYRAVEKACIGKTPPVFSYLDAKTFELRVDPAYHEKVLMEVKPTLRDLVALHGNPLKRDLPCRNVTMQSAATALAYAAPDGLQFWREWCDKTLRQEQIHTGKNWRSNTILKQVTLPWPAQPSLRQAVIALNTLLGFPADAPELVLAAVHLPAGIEGLRHLCKWLDGEWLEHYVLSQIIAVAERCALHDYGMTLDTDERGAADFNFEFDVAALRGYQLFGISCTTGGSKSAAKSKLFEASIRARQLGGDEARVGLVCGYTDPNILERELIRSWDAEGQIKVFGPADFPQLAEKLADWFGTAQ